MSSRMPSRRLSSQTHASRSASGYGSGFRSTAWMTLKIAVFAPMPRLSVATATSVKPGFLTSMRAP
jgi:hypothetical protein